MAIELGSAYGRVSLDASGVKKGSDEAGNALEKIEERGSAALAALGLSIAGLGIVLQRVGATSIGWARDFESDMTSVSLTTRNMNVEFDQLHTAAIQVGGDTRLLGVSASGAAQAMDGLFKAGLSTTAVFGDLRGYMQDTTELGGALRASIDLAAASELNMVSASELAAVTLSTFGSQMETDAEKAEFINRAMDNFVRTADASVASVSDLAAALQTVGPDAARMGLGVEVVNNALAILSTRGIAGAEAGTALKSMLLNMTRTTPQVRQALEELNVTLYDQHGAMRPLPAIIAQLERGLRGMTDQQRDQYLVTLAGTYGVKALTTLLAEGTAGWDAMAEAVENATGIQERAAAMTQTYAGRQEALQGEIETLGIMIGEKLLPAGVRLMELLSVLIEEHGPELVEVAGQVAEAVIAVVDALDGQGSALTTTAVQFAGLAGGVGVAAVAYAKIAPLIGPVGTFLSDAAVGMDLWIHGSQGAKVATLGWGAALGPLVAVLAAVATTLYAVNKAVELHREIQARNTEVSEQWNEFLEQTAAESENAAQVAERYARKQAELAQIHRDGGIAAALLIDKTKVLSANTEELNRQLFASSTSYDDYYAGIQRVNAGVRETATSTNWFGAEVVNVQMLLENSVWAMTEQEYNALKMAQTMREAGVQFGVTGAQSAAFAAQVAESATDATGAMDGVSEATLDIARAAEEMAKRVEEAWRKFEDAVRSTVERALQAYAEGNEEMLAEQQEALARLLWNQTDTMLALGQITEGQAMAMKTAVAAEYGIMVSESELMTGRLLAMYNDWAAGGKTSADDIIAAITNIGPAAAQMATDQEAAIAASLESWAAAEAAVIQNAGAIALSVDAMAGDISADIARAAGDIAQIEGALNRIVNREWGVEVFVRYNAVGQGTEFGSPNFKAYYALERLQELAETPVSVTMGMEQAAYGAQSLNLAGALPEMRAPGGAPVTYDQRSYTELQMQATVQSEVDVELVARRVAEYIRSRQ